MVERGGNTPEDLPLTPQDFVMQIRGFFEDMAGHPEFQTWETALDDVIELRRLERQKKRIILKQDEPISIQSKADTLVDSLHARFKREKAKMKGEGPDYKFAFQLMTITAMNLEFAYRYERNRDPTEAADRDLGELKEYVETLN